MQARRPNCKSAIYPVYRKSLNKNQNIRVKPFKMTYKLNPFKEETVNKYMEGFADDITLSIENSVESLQGVTNIIESF